LTVVPFPKAASWVRWLAFSALMIVLGRGMAVPAPTAGIGVGVAVGGMAVGRGMDVGTGVDFGAQAVSRIMNRRTTLTRFFIFISFPKRKTN
jgi:hypothetical protein